MGDLGGCFLVRHVSRRSDSELQRPRYDERDRRPCEHGGFKPRRRIRGDAPATRACIRDTSSSATPLGVVSARI